MLPSSYHEPNYTPSSTVLNPVNPVLHSNPHIHPYVFEVHTYPKNTKMVKYEGTAPGIVPKYNLIPRL